MVGESFFKQRIGVDWPEFRALPRDRAAALVREGFVDLLHLLGRTWHAPNREPAKSVLLAASLEQALQKALQPEGREWQGMRDRIIVDGLTRSEYDRDQNVYMNLFFTRLLTRALPDVVFQPSTHRELEVALQWARGENLAVTTRGAGSTAMGGSVPNDGGLLLDLSRFDFIQIDLQSNVAAIGAGARFKAIHRQLAARGLTLKTYPSNLGGTLAGWFGTGGFGLNAFKYGAVRDHVRAVSVVLPRGHHVRLHDDGRLDVLGPDEATQRLTAEQGEAWMRDHEYPPLCLSDLAGSEGQLGIFLAFSIDVVPLSRFTPFCFEFDEREEALHFMQWIAESTLAQQRQPANLKYLSPEHVEAAWQVRGAASRTPRSQVYVDFDDAASASAFETSLESGRWRVQNASVQATRWFDERFRPQQTKRLGPGLLASEILLPVTQLESFLHHVEQLATGIGIHLESEVYFLGNGLALALPGFLTRGPRLGFHLELGFAAMLVEMASAGFEGRPYVLGRWQSPYFGKCLGRSEARRQWRVKKQADPQWILNRGTYYRPVFRSHLATWMFRLTFRSNLALLRRLYSWPLVAAIVRRLVRRGTSPARSRKRIESQQAVLGNESLAHRARGCVNCGECNSVCPVFHDAKIRLPQMLTHLGENLRSPGHFSGTQELLLDLCMRCGNCEQVCQADIPHRVLFTAMEERTQADDASRQERQLTILNHLRHSERYTGEFLRVRPGGYVHRTPASLSGETSYLLRRAGAESPAETACIHCGLCVSVCPTAANHEYEDPEDLRHITTDEKRCIGCGTCVEVCPSNRENGGRTLRVMEAPGREFFEVLEALQSGTEERAP